MVKKMPAAGIFNMQNSIFLGYRPPLTIVGTQSRRWPGSATSNTTFDNDDLLDRELTTIQKFVALAGQFDETGV